MCRDFQLGCEAGIRFAFGTGLIGGPTHPLAEAAVEFVLAVELGTPPSKALVAGTLLSAEVLGLASTMGSIEVGKIANFVGVAGNPVEDITAVRRPVFVMKNGREISLKGTCTQENCHVNSP
ncbi:amidohydrolase family protein [Aquamicrobium soli]|uniref:Amidohydrolase family protein n=1 Tax=Aquamicrobium soli TaxID=1811518 RepID=A0ABV7K9F9_9HYPH